MRCLRAALRRIDFRREIDEIVISLAPPREVGGRLPPRV